ncbi:hypothetical protein BH09SUM1_BH09SUM1_09220 [soil metagenome]
MSFMHKELAAGRWNSMSLLEQLANIGSEVDRALRWKAKGNSESCERARDRALELFYFTVDCPSNRDRLKEIVRAREVFLDFLVGENEYGSTAESLSRYYLAYATAWRLKRHRSAQ